MYQKCNKYNSIMLTYFEQALKNLLVVLYYLTGHSGDVASVEH